MPTEPEIPETPALKALREQLLTAAEVFTSDAQPLAELLKNIVADIERASQETLEIFPVKHHSPASAYHLVARLQNNQPKVIFMEMCEDLLPSLAGLEHCQFPVALQAFAPESKTFPPEQLPLNLVAPLSEFSAEYQAIAYCKNNPDTKLIFVDRAADHCFQWQPQEDLSTATSDEKETTEEKEGETLHTGTFTVRMGAVEPTFDEFLEVLLKNAKVRHYSEWWTQYVEGPTLSSDYATYRHIFFLVGSLLRRIGITKQDREQDEKRERFMWTRIREYLRKHKLKPQDALYICGAIHAASDIPEFGSKSKQKWTIPARTDTNWLYGIVPSSYTAIEHQFSLPPGEIAIAQKMWEKALKASKLVSFKIKTVKKSKKTTKNVAIKLSKTKSRSMPKGGNIEDFLTRPPEFIQQDNEQLLWWCVDIVKLARKNGYSSSTADTIAIYHTSNLLANLRDRPHPSPYDFQEAAITCLEKDRTPKKRNIQRLTEIMLGGDRVGKVGYESLPPLAQNVYDRLEPLGIDLSSSRIQRALLNFEENPELLGASELLWKLRYLEVDVRPIMGERSLGHRPVMESWDIAIGKHQSSIINLGYEGVTVEQVLEQRLKKKAYGINARSAIALEAAEDSLLYLGSIRLTTELGKHATNLLWQETAATDAPEIFQRVRRLVHYYRTVGIPLWIKDFVKTGYQHYATLLPQAFVDRGTNPAQLAAMLAFIFTQEALAFSMGCERSQLIIAVKQAEPKEQTKIALLWATEWVLDLRSEASLREKFIHLIREPLLLPAFPEYLSGFLLALEFTPRISRLVVEMLSRAFAELPDEVLIPWLPKLIMALRPLGPQVTRPLLKEANILFPKVTSELANWQFSWEHQEPEAKQSAAKQVATKQMVVEQTSAELSATELMIANLLTNYPETINALTRQLGIEPDQLAKEPTQSTQSTQSTHPVSLTASESAIAGLLEQYPDTLQALVRPIQQGMNG